MVVCWLPACLPASRECRAVAVCLSVAPLSRSDERLLWCLLLWLPLLLLLLLHCQVALSISNDHSGGRDRLIDDLFNKQH